MEQSRIKVAVRVRPINSRELVKKCNSVVQCDDQASTVQVDSKPEAKQYAFDHVYGPTSSQENVFQTIGAPLTESCLEGFNGTIIAYGQTGSGKTHTLFGDADSITDRGLVPRVFEFLWQKINMAEKESAADPHSAASYSCKCSFYEIYNERVFDLLDTTGGNAQSGLNVREDQKKGVFVDGLSEEVVKSPSDATKVMSTGYKNRHVSSTAMNRDSSRSHAVFLLSMMTSSQNENGVKVTSGATFSLVDLAGSERQKSTKTEGVRLKEASKINQSLSTLGSVIHALSNGNDSKKFVRYRDSTLTFLLRDSLGGNSKTVLIANISPSADALSETLGTLKFAQRAKSVRNNVTANTFTSGNVEALQNEIAMLRAQLAGESPVSMGAVNRRASMVGRRKSTDSTTGGSIGNSANPVHSVFHTLNDSVLLSASLNRFKSIDEARTRAELKIHDLITLQKQQDRGYAALQAKLSTLQKQLNRVEGDSDADAQGEGGLEEMVELEVSVVREKLQVEVLRYKSRMEQLERAASHADILELWSVEKEDDFRDTVNSRVAEVERSCRALDTQFMAISNDKFEEVTGYSISEAQSLKSRCEELTTRAEEVEKKNAELTIDVLKSQTIISELQEGGTAVDKEVVSRALNDNAVLLRSFRDLEDQLTKKSMALQETEQKLEASSGQIASLQSELKTHNDAGDLEIQLRDAEEMIRRMESDDMQKSRDIETLAFDRDATQESLEVLETQCQTLLQEKAEDAAQIESLKLELESLLRSSSQDGNDKLIDAMNLSSQYVSEITRLQDTLQKERQAHDATKEHSSSLDKEVELNRSVLVDMQDKLGALREKDLKVRELSATKDELLVELADKSQQIEVLLAAKEENNQLIRDLKSDCDELQSRVVVMGSDEIKNEGDSEPAEGAPNGDCFTSSSTVRKLRADLLQALQKVEENAEAHSKLLSCESELRALRLLFEDSKQKLTDADARAASMMEQLLGVDGDISRARNANADFDKMKATNEKLEKKTKKLEKERDAGREVLAQVEGDLEDLREKFQQSEIMLTEIRMENTNLRESASTKVRETKEIKALHKDIKNKNDEIQHLNNLLQSSRSIAVKAKTDLKAAAMEDTVTKIVGRKRGLAKRDGNAAMPGLANLPPPPGAL